MENAHSYKGHNIILEAGEKEGRWVCKYTVIHFGAQDMVSHGDYAPGDFPSEDEAKAAALQAAKKRIDSEGGQEAGERRTER